jgi:hypothetical protein
LLAEVVMARQPGVFVRSLDPEEAQRLVRITRTTKDRVRLRRHPAQENAIAGYVRGFDEAE